MTNLFLLHLVQLTKLLIAGNFLVPEVSELGYYAILSKTNVHHFTDTNIAHGTAPGKLVDCAWGELYSNLHVFLFVSCVVW
ncbi:hypothetical protein BDQ17DRAFT_1247485 [Cyathus striatus]|nr:hypothetical protein BDQ17DRAFT_1247485 [Cyathus striatus]